jgi:hypothetical protein
MPHVKKSKKVKNVKNIKKVKKSKNKRIIRRRRVMMGGEEPNTVSIVPGFVFYHKNTYGTLNFGFTHGHAMTLHHYMLDINMIAYINFIEGVLYTHAYNKGNMAIVMQKYDIEENHLNYNEFVNSNTLLVGETKYGNPVFLKKNNYFTTIENETMLPTYALKEMKNSKDKDNNINPIIPNSIYSKVYEFVPENEYVLPGIEKLVGNTVSNIKDGKIMQVHEIFNGSDLYEATSQKDAQYDLYRLGLTDDQKNVISQHHLNYQIIKDLNYDLSLDSVNPRRKKYRYNERLGFFDIERMKKPFQKYKSNTFVNFIFSKFDSDKYDGDTKLSSDAFKRSLLVGFAGPYQQDTYQNNGEECEVWRPVYLTPNGWFNDGTAIYSPDYNSIAITEKMMVDNGLADTIENEIHSFLTGKMAYCFKYGGDTMNSINFNRQHNFYIMDAMSRSAAIGSGLTKVILYTITYYTSILALIPTIISYLGPIIVKSVGGTRKRRIKIKTRKKKTITI